jgi:hypothetical protein
MDLQHFKLSVTTITCYAIAVLSSSRAHGAGVSLMPGWFLPPKVLLLLLLLLLLAQTVNAAAGELPGANVSITPSLLYFSTAMHGSSHALLPIVSPALLQTPGRGLALQSFGS